MEHNHDHTDSAEAAIAPFLSKHIPTMDQHAPDQSEQRNTKYCYRHRPDLKCKRQADGPQMDELQKQMDLLPAPDAQAVAHVWTTFAAAPGAIRNLMLEGILSQCCFTQIQLVANTVRDLVRIDPASVFPPEIMCQVMSYLDTSSLCRAAQVSTAWNRLANDDLVWENMCQQHIDRKCEKCGWGIPLLEQRRLERAIQKRKQISRLASVKRRRTEDVDMDGSDGRPSKRACDTGSSTDKVQEQLQKADISESWTPPQRRWKDIYSERYKVESNWRKGLCKTTIFRGHTNGVTCMQMNDDLGVLATGSYDATIKIWNMETGQCIQTLAGPNGHTSGIRCLQFDDQKLISGSLDMSIKIWNWRTGKLIRTITSHSAGVIALNFEGKLMASGSADHTIKLFNFEDNSCKALRGHTDWVNCVKLHSASGILFSASDDMTVKMWDVKTHTCIKTFEGHVGQIQQVVPLTLEPFLEGSLPDNPRAFHVALGNLSSSSSATLPQHCPTHILTAALDSTIKLFDVTTGKCVKTLFGHIEGVWALAADTLRVISGAQDRMVKLWDLRTGKCVRTIADHRGAISCLSLGDYSLATGGEDCEVRLYNFRVGPGVGSSTDDGSWGCVGSEDEENVHSSEDAE